MGIELDGNYLIPKEKRVSSTSHIDAMGLGTC